MELLKTLAEILGVFGTCVGIYHSIFKIIEHKKIKKEKTLKDDTDYVLKYDQEFYASFFKYHVREELFTKGTGIKIPHQYQAGLIELHNKFRGKYSWDKIKVCYRYFIFENGKVVNIDISKTETTAYWINIGMSILILLLAGLFYFLLSYQSTNARERIVFLISFVFALSYSAFFLYLSGNTFLGRRMKKDFNQVNA
jgi:hypothetical protein